MPLGSLDNFVDKSCEIYKIGADNFEVWNRKVTNLIREITRRMDLVKVISSLDMQSQKVHK